MVTSGIYVLPTKDIIQQYNDLDHLFTFYEGGVRAIIRDTILLSSAWKLELFSERYHLPDNTKPLTAKGMMDNVMREYSNSEDAIFQRFSENTTKETFVQIAVENIDYTVSEMMFALFKRQIYTVVKRDWQWFGNDLIVKINTYEYELSRNVDPF